MRRFATWTIALRLESAADPLRARDLANRAWLLDRAGRFEEALEANEAALALVTDYAAALHQKIDVLIRLKRLRAGRPFVRCGFGTGRAKWLDQQVPRPSSRIKGGSRRRRG